MDIDPTKLKMIIVKSWDEIKKDLEENNKLSHKNLEKYFTDRTNP